MIRTARFFALGVSFVVTSTSAYATPIDSSQLEPVTVNIAGFANPPGAEQIEQSTDVLAPVDSSTAGFATTRDFLGVGGQLWEIADLSVSGNADPFIDLDFIVTNVSVNPIDIIVSAVVPIVGSFPAPNVISGAIEGTYSDTGGDPGVSLQPIGGDPIYTGTVDGNDALPITVVTIDTPTPGIVLTFGPTTDTGLSFIDEPSTIGIDIAFTVSPGDTVTIDSSFSLEPIPEPTTAAIALLGLSLTLGVSRCR